MNDAFADPNLVSLAGSWVAYIVTILLLPFLTIGVIRKTKARMQNRIGAPILQLFFDVCKLFRKQETLSETASWLFRSSSAINLANMLLIATLVPWLSFKPDNFYSDLFLIAYLFALSRLLTILAALDTGSAFGAFGGSREATLSMLVEPASILSFASLGVLSHTSDLNKIFSYSNTSLMNDSGIWLVVGTTIILSSLVELSRMPVDDPTTHLELTMIHEAMILEASGRNLALTELARAVRMTVLFGLTAQCYLHAIPAIWTMNVYLQGALNVVAILLIALTVGLFESVAVKLQWRKVPEFIAYAISMSLFASMTAVARGLL